MNKLDIKDTWKIKERLIHYIFAQPLCFKQNWTKNDTNKFKSKIEISDARFQIPFGMPSVLVSTPLCFSCVPPPQTLQWGYKSHVRTPGPVENSTPSVPCESLGIHFFLGLDENKENSLVYNSIVAWNWKLEIIHKQKCFSNILCHLEIKEIP